VRTKILHFTDGDVLVLIDRRAAECETPQGAYLFACALGLLAPVEPAREEKLPAAPGGAG